MMTWRTVDTLAWVACWVALLVFFYVVGDCHACADPLHG